MRTLMLGCGEMGRVAIADLFLHGGCEHIVVGVRKPEQAKARLSWSGLSKQKLEFCALDLNNPNGLADFFSGFDVVVNCAGPNYKYEITVAEAAIAAHVNVVDLNDDYETTLRLYELDQAAKDAGVAVVMGLGASPGVNNILVRAAANELDEVDEIHTSWIMSAADPGGMALSQHLLFSLSGPALTVQDRRMIEVQSFRDGKERIEFLKPVGPMDVYHVGHPEPITLSRAFPEARTVDDKASFNPPFINELILRLGEMVRHANGTVNTSTGPVEAMDYAAAQLLQACKRVAGVPRDGALRVEVKGKKGRNDLRIIYSAIGRITNGTGIPAAIGAKMLLDGKIVKTGILAPEDCIDPEDFLEEMLNRGIGDLEEERIPC